MQKKMFLKLLVLGGISILMLIALASIGGITSERKHRLYEVERDIADSYAGEQKIIGPLVSIQYRETWTERVYNKEQNLWYDESRQKLNMKYVYPDTLNYEGSLQVQERYRGIFKANVFQSKGTVLGSIMIPEKDALRIVDGAELDVLSARICLLISDPRGLSKVPQFMWNNSPLKLEAGGGIKEGEKGIHAVLSVDETLFGKTSTFSMELQVHGMGQIGFVPIGSDNHVKLESTWAHPSFVGDFLATDRTVSDSGFIAEWHINGLASTAQESLNNHRMDNIQYFGVSLIDPVNPYPLTDRALKYGFLFIFITFASFFFFELLKQLQIHPIQYSFVGLAQTVFFLLLLSLSEHMRFGVSYLIASAATILVIGSYLCCVLKGIKRGILFSGLLSLLYGVLYGLLQSEDHALVAGSILLFILMALLMILTRHVDWYALGQKSERKNIIK